MGRASQAAVPGDTVLKSIIEMASLVALTALMLYAMLVPGPAWAQSSVRPPDNATTSAVPRAGAPRQVPGRPDVPATAPREGEVPGAPLGNNSDADIWRALREGRSGNVSIPDKKAGQLIRGAPERLRSEAEVRAAMRSNQVDDGSIAAWVMLRQTLVGRYGAYAMGGTLALLALFFLIRGRIKVEHGLSGRLIERFTSIERIGHWLLAISFIILAITGLNLLYGRQALIPLLGPEAFAAIAYFGKLTHNYVAFAFMAGLVLIFVNWFRYNLPHPRDLKWLLLAGGLFTKGVHPSAKKFNAGQKIIFWLVILGGVSISLSGIALMFPFQTAMFGKTFAFLNGFGFDLPQTVSPIQEMQYQSLWHAVMALFLICVALAHIYIGSIGMEGAIDAVASGQVDENWAKEHHDLWVEEVKAAERKAGEAGGARVQPAE